MSGQSMRRHCEVLIKGLDMASPQYTRDAIGPSVCAVAARSSDVHEVFPSAAYRKLALARARVRTCITVDSFADGPKDMLDAVIGALAFRESDQGRGTGVGGTDGMGTIVLLCVLRPAEARHPALQWPGVSQ